MKKAFTLVELMVVIGILAVLVGLMVHSFGGSRESALAAKCLSNMKNLATAAQAYAQSSGYFPRAGSVISMSVNTSRGKSDVRKQYGEYRGWISWQSKDMFPSESRTAPSLIGFGTTTDDDGKYAVTNGALWKYLGGSYDVYICPHHKKAKKNVWWSYLMNAYFGWNASENSVYTSENPGIWYDSFSGAERILLFAEIPFQGAGDWFPEGEEGSTETDGVLQYKGCRSSPAVVGKNRQDGNENLGANHKSGRDYYAHVVFADGHIEKLRATGPGGVVMDGAAMKDLTTYLCTGKSVTLEGSRYEKIEN